MKRRDLVRYLEDHGCELLREGSRHSVFVNRATGRSSTVPRHNEVNDFTAVEVLPQLPNPTAQTTSHPPPAAHARALLGRVYGDHCVGPLFRPRGPAAGPENPWP